MSYIVDIILIAILALVTFIAVKKGFFKTLFDLIGVMLAFILAKTLSETLAAGLFDSFLRTSAEGYLVSVLGEAGTTDFTVQAENVLAALPEGMNGLLQILGFSRETLSAQIAGMNLNGNNFVELLMNDIVAPIGTALIQFILFVVLAVVLSIVIKLLAGLLNKIITKLPIIKRFNSLLGGVLGFIKGIIIVIIVAAVLSVAVTLTTNETLITSVDNSIIVNMLESVLASLSGLN